MSKDAQSHESAVSDIENNEARPEKQQPGNYQRFKAAAKKPKLDPIDAHIMTLLRQDDKDKNSSKDQDMDRGFFLSLPRLQSFAEQHQSGS